MPAEYLANGTEVLNLDDGEIGTILNGFEFDPVRGWTRSELETHLREEYSTYTWLLEPLLERAGFLIQDADTTARAYAAYTCVKRA